MSTSTAELWVVSAGTEKRQARTSRTPVAAPITSPAFPGDPGDGKYLIGGAIGPNGNATLAAMDGNPWWAGDSKMSIVHNYSGNANGIDTAKVDEAHNRGFIASQSIKIPNYSPAQINAGTADGAIDTMAAVCIARAPKPIWLCYYHEPEDNIGSADWATFRGASRRMVTRMRTAGVTNVAWMPIYMNPWTFNNSSKRDWRVWHPDWTGTAWQNTLTMDLLGLDTYNPLPWSVKDGGPWHTATRSNNPFSQMFETAKGKMELFGYPQWDYVIPEFGTSNAFAGADPNWLPWYQAAVSYAIVERIKAFCYWDNSDDIGRWSMAQKSGVPHSDSNGTKLTGWNYLVNHAARVKVAA